MASLLTQLRNQKARYRTEFTTGNRYLQSYNKYLTDYYQPAYDRAKAYQPVVDDAYNTYKTAFDAAKSEYDQLVATKKSAFDAAVTKGTGLAQNVASANEGYANYKKTNLDPYEAEYASREAALTSARNTAYTAATKEYDTKSSALFKDYETKYNKAKGMESKVVNKYKDNMWVQKNTVFNPYNNVVQTFEEAKYLGGNQFEYKIGGQTYNIKQAPDYFDVSFGFQLQKRVEDYNFYSKTFASGDAQQYGIPSYVNQKWLDQEYKTIQSMLDPTSGTLKTFQTTGETQRANYATAFDSVNTYISSTLNPAKTAYENFLSTSKSDYATSQADLATTAEAKAVQDYVSVLNTQRRLATDYYNANVNPQQEAYNTFISNEYNPAKSAYEKIATDTGYVTSRTESQRTKYVAARDKFDELKAQYEAYAPTLEDLKSKYTASMAELSGMQEEIDRLQRSVNIDLDPRKSSVRVSSRQTILTSGSKRAGAAR